MQNHLLEGRFSVLKPHGFKTKAPASQEVELATRRGFDPYCRVKGAESNH